MEPFRCSHSRCFVLFGIHVSLGLEAEEGSLVPGIWGWGCDRNARSREEYGWIREHAGGEQEGNEFGRLASEQRESGQTF